MKTWKMTAKQKRNHRKMKERKARREANLLPEPPWWMRLLRRLGI